MRSHDYSVEGVSRSSIGRYLGAAAAVIASSATAALVKFVHILTDNGLPDWSQTLIAIPISAGLAYTIVHWAYDRYFWRWLRRISHVPEIDGKWSVSGETLNDEGTVQYSWTGTITISQSWEKIRVHLETNQSLSNSVSAAMISEADGCWMLLYSYRNEPRVGQNVLYSHLGYCEMRFSSDLESATSEYFNAKGRGSFGRMTVTRIGK